MTLSIINPAYIYDKPHVINQHNYRQATIGDLHANAMKFIYFLVAEGIFDISDAHYRALSNIYQKDITTTSDDVLRADIATFNDIIDNGLRLKNPTFIRLIGDEVGDRGQNDYFILKILEKLHRNHLDVEIMISNHGLELVHGVEKLNERNGAFKRTILNSTHAPSLDNMEALSKRGIVSQQQIINLVDSSYKPYLKALSYSLHPSRNEITLYSHAAIDMNAIDYLARKLGVSYNDATTTELAQTIDAVNDKIQVHVQNGTLHTLYDETQLLIGYENRLPMDAFAHPLEFIMWNRRYEKDSIDRKAECNGYKVNYVHGHDNYDPYDDKAHILNLDNELGKDTPSKSVQGMYSALRSHDINLACKLGKDDISKLEQEAFKHKLDLDTEGMLDLPSMCIVAGFVAAIGIATVALAITVLSMGIVPAAIAGITCSSVALVTALTTLGFFQPIAPQQALPAVEMGLTNNFV